MAAPVFVASYASAWNDAAQVKTASVTVAAGDVLVVVASTENGNATVATPAGGGLTYTLRQSIELGAPWATAYVWTATAAAPQTFTLSATVTPAGFWAGFVALRFAGSDGVGSSGKVNDLAAPSLGLNTTGANSAIAAINGDWNAADGAVRTWRAVNAITPTAGNGGERLYSRDPPSMTAYVAYWADAGAAGLKTVGLSAPGGQKYSIVAVEVLGSAGAAAQNIIPAGIATTEAFGVATVAPGPVAVSPAGIATAEAHGAAVVAPGAVTVAAQAITPAEAFGAATLTPGPVSITPTAIPSGEAFGTGSVSAGGALITPTGIASAEAHGVATVTPGPVTITAIPIGTGEAFGLAVVGSGAPTISPAGIATAEAHGVTVVTVGPVTITPGGIPSGEAFGQITIAGEPGLLAGVDQPAGTLAGVAQPAGAVGSTGHHRAGELSSSVV